MSRYPHVKRNRGMWMPKFDGAYAQVIAENGAWGLGPLWPALPLAPVIGHFNEQLAGQDCFATERLADMMFRLTKPYGTTGMASYAISAVDLALWDLKGKLLGLPAYRLLGGPAREKMFCYCTGNDVDWCQELGFRAFKLACPYGPADGLDGLRKNEEFIAKTRAAIGDDCELMLDCWMAFDVEYNRAPGRSAAPLPSEVDGGMPDPRGYGWARAVTRAPALANPGHRRALVYALPIPVGHSAQGGGYPATRHHVVRRGNECVEDRRCCRGRRRQRDDPRRREQCLWPALHVCLASYALAGMLRRLSGGRAIGGMLGLAWSGCAKRWLANTLGCARLRPGSLREYVGNLLSTLRKVWYTVRFGRDYK